jgi:hypothetical protein
MADLLHELRASDKVDGDNSDRAAPLERTGHP